MHYLWHFNIFILCWNGYHFLLFFYLCMSRFLINVINIPTLRRWLTCCHVCAQKRWKHVRMSLKSHSLHLVTLSSWQQSFEFRRRCCEDFTGAWPRNREATTGSLTRNRCARNEWHVCKTEKLQSPEEGLQNARLTRALAPVTEGVKNVFE